MKTGTQMRILKFYNITFFQVRGRSDSADRAVLVIRFFN